MDSSLDIKDVRQPAGSGAKDFHTRRVSEDRREPRQAARPWTAQGEELRASELREFRFGAKVKSEASVENLAVMKPVRPRSYNRSNSRPTENRHLYLCHRQRGLGVDSFLRRVQAEPGAAGREGRSAPRDQTPPRKRPKGSKKGSKKSSKKASKEPKQKPGPNPLAKKRSFILRRDQHMKSHTNVALEYSESLVPNSRRSTQRRPALDRRDFSENADFGLVKQTMSRATSAAKLKELKVVMPEQTDECHTLERYDFNMGPGNADSSTDLRSKAPVRIKPLDLEEERGLLPGDPEEPRAAEQRQAASADSSDQLHPVKPRELHEASLQQPCRPSDKLESPFPKAASTASVSDQSSRHHGRKQPLAGLEPPDSHSGNEPNIFKVPPTLRDLQLTPPAQRSHRTAPGPPRDPASEDRDLDLHLNASPADRADPKVPKAPPQPAPRPLAFPAAWRPGPAEQRPDSPRLSPGLAPAALRSPKQGAPAEPRDEPAARERLTIRPAEERRGKLLERLNLRFRFEQAQGRVFPKEPTLAYQYRLAEREGYKSIGKMKLSSTPVLPDGNEMVSCLARVLLQILRARLRRLKPHPGLTRDSPNEDALFIEKLFCARDRNLLPERPGGPGPVPATQTVKPLDLSRIDSEAVPQAPGAHTAWRSFSDKRGSTPVQSSDREACLSQASEPRAASLASQIDSQEIRVEVGSSSGKSLQGVAPARGSEAGLSGFRSPGPPEHSEAGLTGVPEDREDSGSRQRIFSNIKRDLLQINEKSIEEAELLLSCQLDPLRPSGIGLEVLKKNRQLVEEEIRHLREASRFEQLFEDPRAADDFAGLPRLEEVKHFVSNVYFSCKLERQTLVAALVYLEKLIFFCALELTAKNWRRLLLTALVVASKVWDDESLENHQFARILADFGTKNLNQMEKLFLEKLDYDLCVPLDVYTKYYFYLKRFSLPGTKNPKPRFLTFEEIKRNSKPHQGRPPQKARLKRTGSFDFVV